MSGGGMMGFNVLSKSGSPHVCRKIQTLINEVVFVFFIIVISQHRQ